MKDNDSRRRDEIAKLARLLPVPAERDLPADREQPLKEHLMSEFRVAGPDGRAPGSIGRAPGRSRRPKRTTLVAAAGAGALVVATAVAAVALGPVTRHAPPPAAGGPVLHTTAARLLAKVADAASRQPAPVVRDSQYEYVKTMSRGPAGVQILGQPVPSPSPADQLVTRQTQVWESVSDLCQEGLVRTTPPITGMGPDGYFTTKGPGTKCPDIGGLNDPTYRLLQSLPTSPRTLLNLIYATEKGHGPGPDQEAFTTIGDLLTDQISPPRVSAALYRAAALIPGVTVVPDAVNATGQHGVAVSLAANSADNYSAAAGANNNSDVVGEWIFDKTTLQMIGESTIVNGTVTSVTAIVAAAFVDRLGEVPPPSG